MKHESTACTLKGSVATIEIRRQEARNTLNSDVLIGILSCLERLSADKRVRILCITGQGERAFCAGADLKDTASLLRAGPSPASPQNLFADMLHALLRFPLPTVARVNGHTLGGGMGLLLACDLAVAADDVFFSTPEVRVGLFPYMVMPLLHGALGPRKAMDMALTGRRVLADEALQMGLIHRSVPRTQLDAQVQSLVEEVLKGGPMALAMGKAAVRQVMEDHLHQAIDSMAAHFSENIRSVEFREGVAAFMERREPAWRGNEP